jgi:hypothetical protein
MLLTALGVAPVAHAARHRVGVAWPGGCRDLIQIQFQGSRIFVHFVYQPDGNGIMNRVEVPPGSTYTFNVTDSADATTRKVKYDHPLNGRAHFSQDGRVVTTVRNQAERLDSSAGHLFSLEIAGIDRFRAGNRAHPAR